MNKKTAAHRDLQPDAKQHSNIEPWIIQANQCAAYLRLLANRMALCDWSFVVSLEQPRVSGHAAEIALIQGRRLAELRVSCSFSQMPPEAKRHLLVHELIHCHFAAAHLYADEVLEIVSMLARRAFDLNMEMGIDGMADAIAPFMPLPDF